MIRPSGDRLEVEAAMTLANAAALLEEGKKLLGREETVFDLARVDSVDSSALAVVFGWQREAAGARRAIRIVNPPQDLLSLAQMYGVAELLPL